MGKHYKQITFAERILIQDWFNLGMSARKIAKRLNRSNSSISREIRLAVNDLYDAKEANDLTIKKRASAKKHSKITHNIIEQVDDLLAINITPEQISGRLALENKNISLSISSIYRLIYKKGWQERLPRKGKKYKKRTRRAAGAKLIPNRVDIDERPEEVERKDTIGHWEGDTVHGSDGYFVTLVERHTKVYLFARVKNKSKKEVAKAIVKLLKPFKKQCKTITFDNGGEFAAHEKISRRLKCKIYFAKPYHSWERGLNENSNGLLRRFFPKGTAIFNSSQKELNNIALMINLRPRKTLNFLTPIEVLTGKRVSLIMKI